MLTLTGQNNLAVAPFRIPLPSYNCVWAAVRVVTGLPGVWSNIPSARSEKRGRMADVTGFDGVPLTARRVRGIRELDVAGDRGTLTQR